MALREAPLLSPPLPSAQSDADVLLCVVRHSPHGVGALAPSPHGLMEAAAAALGRSLSMDLSHLRVEAACQVSAESTGSAFTLAVARFT